MAGRLGFSKCCGPQLFGRMGEVGAKSSQQAWATTFSIWQVGQEKALDFQVCTEPKRCIWF